MTFVSVRTGQAAGRPFMGVLLVNALMDLDPVHRVFGGGLVLPRQGGGPQTPDAARHVERDHPAYARLPFSQHDDWMADHGLTAPGHCV